MAYRAEEALENLATAERDLNEVLELARQNDVELDQEVLANVRLATIAALTSRANVAALHGDHVNAERLARKALSLTSQIDTAIEGFTKEQLLGIEYPARKILIEFFSIQNRMADAESHSRNTLIRAIDIHGRYSRYVTYTIIGLCEIFF